jgi:hypothetical protein
MRWWPQLNGDRFGDLPVVGPPAHCTMRSAGVVARDGRVPTALARPGFPLIPKALALCPFNNALGRRPERKSSASSQQVLITERAGWI